MVEALSVGVGSPASLAEIEPEGQIFLMENHDAALDIWRAAGVKQRVLIHVDAHHDMWWTGDKTIITIANFICPALKEDLVSEVIWVAPDQTFASAKSKRPLLKHLNRILKGYPASSRSLRIEDHRISASVLGKKFSVCALRAIPAIAETVLLDVDIDYLVTPRVNYGESDEHAPLPWCWPSELIEQLRCVQTDLVTIAYSVEGGYTPLKWKYLGDELALRLKKTDGDGRELQGMDHIRQGAEAELCEDIVKSEVQYQLAMELLPESAAPRYRLARLLVDLRRLEEGRELYRQAVAKDATYKGPYSSAGFHYYWTREFATSALEFRALQALDPSDPYSHLGLGLIAKEQKRWKDAEQSLRAALAQDDRLVDAQRALGEVLRMQGEQQEAVTAYERALKLGLMGHKPLSGSIVTNTEVDRLMDPWHCHTHARLAALYEKNGSTTKAINALRIAIAGGFGSMAVRLRLARLYAKRREWRKSAGELWQAVKGSPRDAALHYRRLQRRIKRSWQRLSIA